MALTALLAPSRNAASLEERPPAGNLRDKSDSACGEQGKKVAKVSSPRKREEVQLPVPSPREAEVISKNFRTFLQWQYPSMSETPRFVVEVKPYLEGQYKTVPACVNISATSCDLSEEIEEIFSSYWFRIKAIVGSRQSEYVETDEFILQKHGKSHHKQNLYYIKNFGLAKLKYVAGKIGPPRLNLSRHSAEITVDIYHPELPSVEVQPWIEDIYSRLSYMVIFRNSKNESRKEFTVADCEMSGCSLNIPVPSEGSKYCVSATGYFYNNLLVGAQSEESCIWVPPEQSWGTQVTIVVFTIILTVGVVLSMCYGCKKLRKKNIKLPKSLASVIRSLNADSSYESRSEAKDICAVTVMPVPAVSVPSSINDDEALLNVESEEEAVTPENLIEGTSSGPLPEASGKVEETSAPENTGVPSEVEQNHEEKEMNFILDSNQTDVCSNSSGPVVSATETRQEVIPSSCPKFSGYDKPHVPLDMLIDVGEEQPVIAYRSTE
ncbi:hypothetical protein ASZ78_010055 [Callipepla squamata]|uniref:Fibronectin type-III domain-containing protein n=1 Tax=Callipepla squamata TaxID=9009 RepID=A0A226NLR9_CALSU|nr:hypothetical protein ASZ78_010055 [Callipepla squamata]